MKQLRFWTPKYNPVTSFLLRLFTAHRALNLDSLIFTATTGRSGTMTLTRIFESIDHCASFHEARPDMHGDNLINVDPLSDEYVRFVYNTIKSVNIRRFSENAKYYFEANHMFIKNLYYFIIKEYGDKVKVIHLYRDPVKVAGSIYMMGNWPGTPDGNAWWFDYRCSFNRIKVLDSLDRDPAFSHNFYKCLWYWYEVEERVKEFKFKYPNIVVVDIKTEELNDIQKVENMLKTLEIPFDLGRVQSSISYIENQKKNKKPNEPLDSQLAEDMHNRFRRLLIDRGYLTESAR
jgi:hypothetical protein